MARDLLATNSSALARPPATTGANDYDSFSAALSESPRGRAFLAEYARRNRNADTEMLLAALDRLEALVRTDGTALERLRDELRVLLIAIRLARPDIDAASPLTKAAKLAGLLDLLERRIETMADRQPVEIMPPANAPAPPIEIARLPLSVVPPADEPELPIPSPAVAQPQPIALVRAPAMPEITFIEKAPPNAVGAVASNVEPVAPLPTTRVDPLAPIMALSEAERIALFT